MFRTFETIIIFKGDLTELQYKDKVKEMKEKLLQLPAKRIATERVGKKRLTYKIKSCEYGWYVYFTYGAAESLVNGELDLMLRQDSDVIKFMTIRYDQIDYTPDEDINEQEIKKQPVDVFNLIYGIED